ncbi:MAG: prepilin-type N-terminal cleavage/methylation domain-containing protein [Planctomycetes bacterium]|nr:prepilin-type N-terminal cleavage/methylation domain-containing protein [Planctomycetota bacterium]
MLRHRSGFTLAEMMLVLVILGILMGIGLGGADRMDPGARGLQRMVESFVQSSRDRARATGQNVVLRFEKNDDLDPGRFARFVYRSRLEATFEPGFEGREQIQLGGTGVLGKVGRYGAGLDLTQGGVATVVGRGGTFHSPAGLQVEFDFKMEEFASCKLAVWKDLFEINVQRDGSLQWIVSWGDGVTWNEQNLATPAGSVKPGRWHHLRAIAAGQSMQIILNGKLLAQAESLGEQPPAEGSISLGDPEGRFTGWMDELQVWGLAREEGPELSDDQDAFLGATEVVFDRHGRLDPSVHQKPVPLRISALGEEVSATQIGVFTEEPLL